MLRRNFMQGVAFSVLLPLQATATGLGTLPFSGALALGPQWQPLRLGAGGWVHDIDIAQSDGTMVCQTDTYGAYIWNPSVASPGNAGGLGAWQQLATPSRLPAITGVTDLFNIQEWVAAQGCFAIRVAPSNTSIIYMCYVGYIFKSTNQGVSFSNTGFTRVAVTSMDPNNQDAPPGVAFNFGRRMEIDPINPNNVFVGCKDGLYKTTNGGTGWTLDSTVPGTSDGSGVIVAIDPRTSTQSGGSSQVIYASSYGNGVYKSTNGGGAWTLLNSSGMPTAHCKMKVDSNGVLWYLDNVSSNTSNVHQYSLAGAWTNLSLSGNSGGAYRAIDFDPTNSLHIMLSDGQCILTQSTNGGSVWDYSEGDGIFPTQIATDIPWLANLGGAFGLSCGNILYDSTGKLWFAEGVGVHYGNPPAPFSAWNLISQSAGIEQLVNNAVISVPGGPIISCSWDRPFFTQTNQHLFPSTYQPPNTLTAPPGGTSADYAKSNPAIYFGAIQGELNIFSSGSWSTKTLPSVNNGAGTIAASTPTNLVWSQATGQPYYSTDGGTNWNALGSYFQTNFGITLNTGSSQWNCVADGIDANTFYLFLNGSIYKTVNSGAAWTLAAASPFASGGGSGMLRTVYGKSGHLFYTTGENFNNNHPQSYFLYRSQDHGATWQNANANISEPWAVGIGKQEATGTYPSVFFWGWYNGVPGIWKSKDNCVTFVQIGTFQMYGTFDNNINFIEGDQNQDGACYVSLSGSGAAYYGT